MQNTAQLNYPFSCLLQHLARKQDWLILQHSWVHTWDMQSVHEL